jgi:hypothetical protein
VVKVRNLTKSRLLPRRKDVYYDLVFSYKNTPDGGKGSFIHFDFEAAEKVTRAEFEMRKETLPLEEVLREAKKIINSTKIEWPRI